jgi:RHS repeat-associated protein
MNYMSNNNFYLDNHNTQLDVFPDETQYSYTKNNRIEGITEPPAQATQKGLSFTYGTDNLRRTMTLNAGGTTIKKSYFMNYEKQKKTGEYDKHIYYLDGSVLIKQGNTNNLYYTLSDYDGSIQALVNESGTVVERYAYDPCSRFVETCAAGLGTKRNPVQTLEQRRFRREGKRLNPDNWNLADTRTSFIQDRGFTGHEHIDLFGIINMNARLYDPYIGAFMQPDPYMQDITNPVNFNRYTYCLNNPTKYTDPTGEKWDWNYLNPVYLMIEGMQWINDITVGLRSKMVNIGFPDVNVGYNTARGPVYSIGNNAPVYPREVRATKDKAIMNRMKVEITLTEAGFIDYSNYLFINNLGVSMNNVEYSSYKATNGGGDVNPASAYWHYKFGEKADYHVDISQVNWSML